MREECAEAKEHLHDVQLVRRIWKTFSRTSGGNPANRSFPNSV
ncbi:hypothetical protein ACEQPO_07505 [Bacillus sp. SL00103]